MGAGVLKKATKKDNADILCTDIRNVAFYFVHPGSNSFVLRELLPRTRRGHVRVRLRYSRERNPTSHRYV